MNSEEQEEQIYKDANISSRETKEVKPSRKGKKQGNDESAQQIRAT